jgi:L-ascorbate metabolism protein UlaG (beta-lactamase superfamily)
LTSLRHIVNACLLLPSGSGHLLVDALYAQMPYDHLKDRPARRLPQTAFPAPETLAAMLAGAPPFDRIRGYLFTHLHPDHGNLDVIARAADPSIPVILPATARFEDRIRALPNRLILLRDPVEQHVIDDVTLTAIRVKHDGSSFYTIEAYAFLLETPAGTVFLAGDALTSDANLREAILNFTQGDPRQGKPGKRIDAAFLNYPEVSRERGRELVTKYLKPQRLFFVHFPPAPPEGPRDLGRFQHSLAQYRETLPPITLCDSAG